MSGKRKPKVKSLEAATEAVVWRARILCEMLEGREADNPLMAAIVYVEHALEDYEFAKHPANGHAQQMELQP